MHTSKLKLRTLRARDALVAAVEPDILLFESLPNALGFRPVSVDEKVYADSDSYAEEVSTILDDLTQFYDRLLARLLRYLFETCGEVDRRVVSGYALAIENEVINPSARAFVLSLANDTAKTDVDWINAIATVVIGKAPAEWKDCDLRRFEQDLPHQVATFQRLVALHADYRAHGGGPFQALRLTVTRPDGAESSRLVSVDENQRSDVQRSLDRTVTELADILGSTNGAQNALLAMLGERLIASHTDTEFPDLNEAASSIELLERRVRHG